MYNFITISSSFHQFHPLSKLAAVVPVSIAVVAGNNSLAMAMLGAGLLGMLVLGGLGKAVGQLSKFVLPLAAIVWGAAFFVGTPPDKALIAGLRLYILAMLMLFFGSTTRPAELVRALRQLGLPGSLAVGLLVTLRFIPVLAAEAAKIQAAYSLRGGAGGLPWRYYYRGLMLPLLFKACLLADDLALALRLRAFGSGEFAPYRRVRWRWSDTLAVLGGGGIMVVML